MVVAKLFVTDGGYSFSGARVAVLDDASLNPGNGTVTFNDQLVVQGELLAVEGSGSVKLLGGATVVEDAVFKNLSTTIGGDMTVGGMLKVSSGDATTAGSLTITGNVTAQEMELVVNGGSASVSGNLSVGDDGSITIGGTAKQQYTGTVTAGNLIVNTQENDVIFSYLQVGKLTVGKGATVHVQSSSDSVAVSSSVFPVIDLSGTLALDAPGVTYNDRHTVNVKSDDARLVFGEGSTIADLQIVGMVDASGTSAYTDLLIEAMSRSATVTSMEDLGTLTVNTGSLTVQNAQDAVHGDLILDKGKLKLGAGSDNIMAFDSGAVCLQHGSSLDIGSTTQTLYARNEAESLSLSGASTITGAADGGVRLEDGVKVNYAGIGNSIEAKLTVGQNITLNAAQPEDASSLEISGLISGSGNMNLTGKGIVVLYGANTGYTGTVTVDNGSTLTLLNADSLSHAGVVLGGEGTLSLNAPDAVNLKALTLQDGSSLAISSIVGTQKASTADAVLNTTNGVTFGQGDVVLNLIFSHELDTMKTYNIMTGVTSVDNLRLNVQHNGVELDNSQYKIGLENGLLYMYVYTMTGNVWNGSKSGVWTLTDNGGNWSGGAYDDGKAAIFGDLNGGESDVYVSGVVTPGDIYFTAAETDYVLAPDAQGGALAPDTNIHKLGKADVTLALAENDTMGAALGNVDIQDGTLILSKALAVKGSVTVDAGAQLEVNPGTDGLILANYKASSNDAKESATLIGVTMDAAGIRGEVGAYGNATNLLVNGNAHLSYLNLTNLGTEGNVTLTNVTLMGTGSHALENVTIGAGVDVAETGSYTLSGNLTFDSALTNNGTVTLDNVTNIEIGKITPTEDAGQYKYTFINGGTYKFIGSSSGEKITSEMVSINGVKLSGGLASDITAVFTDNKNGSFTMSITGDTGDPIGIPQWDEDWGKTEKAPAFSRIYAGTDEDNVELAAGKVGTPDYYHYETIVNVDNAPKVNNGKAIAVTLSPGASGELVVGGQSKWGGAVASDHEVWIYDRSEFRNIIGGQGSWAATPQSAATHILVNSTFAKDPDAYVRTNPTVKINDRTLWAKQFIIGGSRWGEQGASSANLVAESYVTVLDGEIYTIFGGSCGAVYTETGWGESPNGEYAIQNGTSHVFIKGGRIGEIFAAGMHSIHIGTQVVEGHENKRAVELVITGGTLGGHHLRVFGGGERGKVDGDIYIRMEGDAYIESQLVGGSNAGTVIGDIEMDLISGTAFRVDAAGIGWTEIKYGEDGKPLLDKDGNPLLDYRPAKINGNVRVNLYRAEAGISDSPGTDDNVFRLGSVTDIDPASRLIGGIYGGMETTNLVEIATGSASTLHFAESGRYELASIVENGYNTSANSVVVTGFDRFELENGTHVVLGLGLFDIDMDPAKELVISGEGVVEVIGHGIKFEEPLENSAGIVNDTKKRDERNLGRNIRLEGGPTLMISTSVIGASGSEDDRTITVTDGSTIDFSGFSLNSDYERNTPFDGLGFNVYICGHGVDGQGAIYKGSYEDTLYPSTSTIADRIILPKVWLTDSASVNVEAGETLHMNAYVNPQKENDSDLNDSDLKDLDLDGNTFTKFGAGDFITHRVDMTPGTILVQQGTFGFDQTGKTDGVDMVLAAGGELKLNATALETADPTDLTLRSLSGAGMVELNGSTLTLHTDKGAAYYEEYMTDVYTGDASSYDQFSEVTGFGYAVFSGLIKDGSGSGDSGDSGGKLAKSGSGVHYISGSSNTYTGGTQLQGGRLYLLGTSEASTFTKDTSKVAAGVAGTGTIEWVSADEDSADEDSADAELYLGHGTRIYNNGTTSVQSGTMTIGVEAVTSSVLAGFVGIHGTVEMGGVEYVEIDTHNLKSIAVKGLYADGTEYVAGTDIDRNKMLLVKASDWDASKSKSGVVTSLSATGYNEATYSGVLSGAGGLSKVGLGTLDLDQTNSYTGETRVKEGTLRLRGWGTVGSDAVHVAPAASLMLSYIGGYGSDETDGLSNDIYLSGTGDAQWLTHDSTDGRAAALISAVGRAVTFTLSGNIHDGAGEPYYSGAGGVLHSGEGTLVLCGDSTYTGGTVITRGVVKVQSAKGLGATAEGQSAVVLNAAADLHLTVEDSASTEKQLVTKLASAGDDIQGDVRVTGNKNATERVLHMADNGYNAAYTTLDEKGTFLLCGPPIDGAGIHSHSAELTGTGTVVVSDARGLGTTATFDTITDYSGDFRVEGDKASIQVKFGTYGGGSIAVSGQQASVQIGGNVSIEAGESLQLSSTGLVPDQKDEVGMGTGAVLVSHGMVSVAAGAELSASRAATVYDYNLSGLEEAASVTVKDVVLADYDKINAYHNLELGADDPDYNYKGRFDADIAINQQAVAGVMADVGLTLAGGSSYKTDRGHISLMGGSLTLDTLINNQLTFNTTLDEPYETLRGDVQLVLFSDVSSVKFIYGDDTKTAKEPGVYYTRADNFLTGCDYVDSQTMLVYDSHAGVVYLQTVPILVPEPTTSTLGLLALTALCARRRRRG